MRSNTIIHLISAHAEGEVGDVIVGGVQSPPGDTLWDQRNFIERDGWLRNFVLNEPRGGVFRHVSLLVPPKHPEAQMGFIIMEPEDTPPMSGSNSICVATVLLESGILPMSEPVTDLILEAPGGLVRVKAACENGKVNNITIRNLPSFAYKLDQTIKVPSIGKITVDIAYGGDSFVIVDAEKTGFKIEKDEARALSEAGIHITSVANEQLGFEHPELPEWDRISFCLFAGKIQKTANCLHAKSAVIVKPGKVDRSPTGTAVSARMAVLHARGMMNKGDRFLAESILGSTFTGRIADTTIVAGIPAIIPEISGRAWITGIHQYMLDPRDPWPTGYRIGDTWGTEQRGY